MSDQPPQDQPDRTGDPAQHGPSPETGADPASSRPGGYGVPGRVPPPPGTPAAEAGGEGGPPALDHDGRPSDGPAPGGPTVVDEGFLETALGVITDPVATMRAITHQPKVGWAIWLTLGIGLITGLAGLADVGADPATEEFLREFPELAEFADLGGAFATAMVVASPFLSLLWITIVAAVLQGTSSLLGGHGRFRAMFVGVAFANVPTVFGVVTPLLALALGTVGSALGGMVSFGLFVWVVILGGVAVRENHGFTTGRAAAAVLIPFAVGFLLIVLLVILVFVFLFAAFGG